MRARNLKPGFFKNEDLAEIEPLGRLLFQGLWCMADREGRLEDRPKRIKVEVLPYDNCNVDKLLHTLQQKNFIIRYRTDNQPFIQIVNFTKHNYPHIKEPASTIPAPDLNHADTIPAPDLHDYGPSESPLLNLDTESSYIAHRKTDAPPKYIFSSQFFDIDQAYFERLQADYPGLNPPILMAEIKKAADWCEDNPKKFKRKSNGKRANVKTFLRNWLNKVEVRPDYQQDGVDEWLKQTSANG